MRLEPSESRSIEFSNSKVPDLHLREELAGTGVVAIVAAEVGIDLGVGLEDLILDRARAGPAP
jgi:hypothetical protein